MTQPRGAALGIPIFISALCHILLFAIVTPTFVPLGEPRKHFNSTLSFLGPILEDNFISFAACESKRPFKGNEPLYLGGGFLRTFNGGMPMYLPIGSSVIINDLSLANDKERPKIRIPDFARAKAGQ